MTAVHISLHQPNYYSRKSACKHQQ